MIILLPLPPERVDETINYEIEDDEVERLKLTLTGQFETIQQIELPETPVVVTEHRFPLYESPDGDLYYPYAPEVHGQPIFGPRLLATIGWLKSQVHCSYTTIEKQCNDVLGFSVSRGYWAKLCNGVVSDSLAEMHSEIKQAIPEQPQLGSDETSFKNNGKKHWIGCITADAFSLFHIAKTRSRKVLEETIGPVFKGILNFDYFSANCSFAWNFNAKAQYCWAHLIREIRFLEKHPDKKTKAWAEQLLGIVGWMKSLFHPPSYTAVFGRVFDSHRPAFLIHATQRVVAEVVKLPTRLVPIFLIFHWCPFAFIGGSLFPRFEGGRNKRFHRTLHCESILRRGSYRFFDVKPRTHVSEFSRIGLL